MALQGAHHGTGLKDGVDGAVKNVVYRHALSGDVLINNAQSTLRTVQTLKVVKCFNEQNVPYSNFLFEL